MEITTQKKVRQLFWDEHPEHDLTARRNGTRSRGQNAQTTDCRCNFVDWLDNAVASGIIDQALAERTCL